MTWSGNQAIRREGSWTPSTPRAPRAPPWGPRTSAGQGLRDLRDIFSRFIFLSVTVNVSI